MKKTGLRKSLSLILCTVLIAALTLFAAGCGNHKTDSSTPSESPPFYQNGDVLGEGTTTFSVLIVDKEGSETHLEIRTDNATVGQALVDLELISGEEGPYGLYVQTVNGISAIYEQDGSYWGFYVDGQYAAQSVDQTEIVDGACYTFKVE